MAAQTWDLAYFTTLVVSTGVGNTDSTGVGNAGLHDDWPIAYVNLVVSATGSGNTDSVGVGSVSSIQNWPFTYWDGVIYGAGSGNTNSTGVGDVAVVNSTWYDISGTVSEPAAGSGNTTSQASDTGVGVVGTGIVSVSGAGNTNSTGVGSISIWGGETNARILRDTYVTSSLYGSKTVSSDTFGDRTVYIHPESTIP